KFAVPLPAQERGVVEWSICLLVIVLINQFAAALARVDAWGVVGDEDEAGHSLERSGERLLSGGRRGLQQESAAGVECVHDGDVRVEHAGGMQQVSPE